jgi:hypothetical protein
VCGLLPPSDLTKQELLAVLSPGLVAATAAADMYAAAAAAATAAAAVPHAVSAVQISAAGCSFVTACSSRLWLGGC